MTEELEHAPSPIDCDDEYSLDRKAYIIGRAAYHSDAENPYPVGSRNYTMWEWGWQAEKLNNPVVTKND